MKELHTFSTNSQWIATLTLTRISGVLSILGSSAILYMILSHGKKRLQQRNDRLLVGFCFFDLFRSTALMVSTAAIPRDTVSSFPIYGVMGNAATCKIQGFFIQFGGGTLFYLASLSLHYLLTIRYDMNDELISRKIEPWMHTISILIPTSTAIAAWCLDLFHHKYTICWISAKPWGCAAHPSTCEAAANAPYFEFLFGYLWMFITILIQVICMILVCLTVRPRERIVDSDGRVLVNISSQISSQRRDTSIQALLTISTTLLTYSFPLALDISANSGRQVSLPFLFLCDFFTPLLGFLNFAVYIRPRYMNVSRSNPQQSVWDKFKSVLFDIQTNRRESGVTTIPIHRRKSTCNTQIDNADTEDKILAPVLKDQCCEDIEIQNGATPIVMDPLQVDLQLRWSNLENVTYLASGGNCLVYSVGFKNRLTVMKMLKPEYQTCSIAASQLEDELEILSRLNHPNICSLYGAGYTSRLSRFLVLERLDGGTLAHKLGYKTRTPNRRRSSTSRGKFTYGQVIKYARDITDAMAYCHHNQAIANGILLHRDLKPDNIGFTANETLKIFDFGLSRVIYDASPDDIGVFYDMTECGSWRYMAPEIADSKPYNQKVDVYSFAIILWEMMMFEKPFDGMTKDEIYEKIVLDGERPPINKRWPHNLVQLMTLCWSPEPDDRPSFIDIGRSLDTMILMEGQITRC